jgi:Spy/CpxP family protein refolding chaperone
VPVTLILVPHDTRWSLMMKTRTLLAGLALAGAATAGVTATAVAQSDPSPAPTTSATTPVKGAADPAAKQARTDFVCAHQDQIKDLMSQRKGLISSRLSLLQEARTSASDAGATKLVARIDTRIAKAQAEATKVDGRMEKLTTWAGEHCTG